MNDIMVNSLIKSNDDHSVWRILWISGDKSYAYIFNMTTMSMPEIISFTDITSGIDSGQFFIEKTDNYLNVVPDSELTKKERDSRDKTWELMSHALTSEPEIFDRNLRGAMMTQIMSVSGKDLKSLHRYLKTYWQRGKTKNAFIPKFKDRGGKGKNRGADNLSSIQRHRKHAGRHSEGDSGEYELMGPGILYEIKSAIVNICLVSRLDRSNLIGRPVVYLVFDTFSKMVTGLHVGLEGPSAEGAITAIANAVSNKVDFCDKFGVSITRDNWPCSGIPSAICADFNLFERKSFVTVVNSFNITLVDAAPSNADIRDVLGQSFDLLAGTASAFLPGENRIEDSNANKHRLDAMLDLHQFTGILIQCVLYYNDNQLPQHDGQEADIFEGYVDPIPLEIWNWGYEHFSGGLRSFPEDTVIPALLPSATAEVTGKGIRFKGLYFVNDRAISEKWFELAKTVGGWKVDISYDPINMSTFYIRLADGKYELCRFFEGQEKYIEKSLYEIAYWQETEKILKNSTSNKQASKTKYSATIADIIAEATQMKKGVQEPTPEPESKPQRIFRITGIRTVVSDDAQEETAPETPKSQPEAESASASQLPPDSGNEPARALQGDDGSELPPEVKKILDDLDSISSMSNTTE